jgi:hypothetical protein
MGFIVWCREKPQDLKLTFMPTINFKSRSIVSAKGRNIYETEENLLKYGKMRDESIKRKQQIKNTTIDKTVSYQ